MRVHKPIAAIFAAGALFACGSSSKPAEEPKNESAPMEWAGEDTEASQPEAEGNAGGAGAGEAEESESEQKAP